MIYTATPIRIEFEFDGDVSQQQQDWARALFNVSDLGYIFSNRVGTSIDDAFVSLIHSIRDYCLRNNVEPKTLNSIFLFAKAASAGNPNTPVAVYRCIGVTQ